MIIVCSLNDLLNVCDSVKPKYLISVIDPGYEPDTPKSVQKHLKLGFDDIVKISSIRPISKNKRWQISEIIRKSKKLGYFPKVILSGREINDGMGKFIADSLKDLLRNRNKLSKNIVITILGMTFKESNWSYVFLAIITSVLVFYLNDFSAALGKTDKLPIELSVWMPIIIIFIFSTVGIIHANQK